MTREKEKRPIGLYLHVPFCVSKCPYCDFYSLTGFDEATLDAYTVRLMHAMDEWAARLCVTADTLYFGGGTPSLLGGNRIAALMEHARKRFGLPNAEITLEANPAEDLYELLTAYAAAGGNRLSLGMQAGSERELRFLGRRHTVSAVERAMQDAHRAGITNVSLDLMLGLEGQDAAAVTHSVWRCAQLGATHVSAYLLKIEAGTPFAERELSLPDEDATADLYLAACDALETHGYRQYEISNFANKGRESRHNLKYWDAQPYLGLGPSAHSFLNGRRWRYDRSLNAFMDGTAPTVECAEISEIAEGSAEEYLMLRLRLTDGVESAAFEQRFGRPLPASFLAAAQRLPQTLVRCDERGVRLTREGFLLSNAVIARLLG